MEQSTTVSKTKLEEVRDMEKRPTVSKIKEEERIMVKKSIEKKTGERKNIPILDIYQAAYLAMKGISPVLFKQGKHIVFVFPNSPEVVERLNIYNLNLPVKILDYVDQLRRLRSQMLSMRD
jgi:hypothetical protein